ncbi:methylation-associated defense system restriction endonuclease subunit S MAD5 [Nocardia farcinica]|uniref:methylation-associated defense system restriction endonuclease subunit S MAD5 n=1 Tax=Nocardia farcinica TaxID=37329 RepID=UPI0018963721|nr:restriction endonuclease subunit S [Nocardia farcinica]MBF6518855.1 restriction endonuclease subunit S [Nocardia farcinica]
MKLVDFDNPVRAGWLADQGFRLDPGPFISETYAARMTLRRVPRTEQLGDLAERIFRPGIFKRHWTASAEHGVPFLSSADIFEADLSTLPMITKKSFDSDPKLPLEPGWTLITRSGMTAGRVTYARNEMKGYACTEDVLRVVPGSRIPAGYLYTFLASRYGTAMIKGGIYGSSIKHIEPPHLVDIPVPRLGNEIESRIDSLIQEAMTLRSQYQTGVVAATEDLFTSAGLADLLEYHWHNEPSDTGFAVIGLSANSLRALNYSPRVTRLIERIRAVGHRNLGEICRGGMLERGKQFKRIDSDREHGVCLISQRQGSWMRPEGRWINPAMAPAGISVPDGTVLVTAQGGGDSLCRPLLVAGKWKKYAYTEHFLRIRSGDPVISGPYLFAYLRSEVAFRIMQSFSAGSMQQDIHYFLRQQLPVPLCDNESRARITETVRQAYRCRDEADALEDEAMVVLEKAIREAAG